MQVHLLRDCCRINPHIDSEELSDRFFDTQRGSEKDPESSQNIQGLIRQQSLSFGKYLALFFYLFFISPSTALPATAEKQNHETTIAVVIDVFRAFTTASYVLDKNPYSYFITDKHAVVIQLASNCRNPLVIGKPEKGCDGLIYLIPNSPTRALGVQVTGRDVIHRTAAGSQGVLKAKDADIVLAAGFVNAAATVRFVRQFINPKVKVIPMGHEGVTPSLEDDICALYIQALIADQEFDLAPYIPQIKEGPGKYLFSEDQWQYPFEDFDRCLEIDRFDFAIRAFVEKEWAILKPCY